MKLLILSGNSCGVSVANAMLQASASKGVHCETADIRQFYEQPDSRYQKLIAKTREKLGYFEGAYDPAHKSIVAGLSSYIRDREISAALCCDNCAIKASLALKRKENIGAPIYGVVTDNGGMAISSESALDGYFIPHEDLKSELYRKGVRAEIFPTGVPVEKGFFSRFGKKAARNYLVIPENKRVYLLLAEGMGYEQTTRFCDEFRTDEKEDFILYVITDRFSPLRERLVERYGKTPSIQIVTLNKKLNVYMECADVILTPPEGYVSFEAAAAGVPMVHLMTVRGPAATAEFFSAHEMSLKGYSVRDAVKKAQRLIEEKALSKRMVSRQTAEVRNDSADRILDSIINRSEGRRI